MAGPLPDLHFVGYIHGRKPVRRRESQPELLDRHFRTPASGNNVSACNKLLKHGTSEATGNPCNYDALYCSAHGEFILDYLRSIEGSDPALGAGGLFVTPM